MMCNKIVLNRIDEQHFKDHIQIASQKTWKKVLSAVVLDKIVHLTECHTYYVNVLCADLMMLSHPPSVRETEEAWNAQLSKHKGKVISELEKLNSNRLKVLTNVALLEKVNEPNGKSFLDKVRLPLSSTQKAVSYLLDYDYIYQDQAGALMVVDPLMKLFLCQRYQ